MVAHVSQWLQSLSNKCEVKATAGLLLLRLPQLVTWSLRELLLLVETCVQELPSNMMKKTLLENVTNSCNLGHLGLRTRNWYLRMASKKQMAALFTAFDILCWEKLNGQHIDAHAKPVLNALQRGGFCMPTK